MLIQLASLVAVQGHPADAVTVTLPAPPAFPEDWLIGESE